MSEHGVQPQSQKKRRPLGLSYLIDENPPWHVCLLLGFQVRAVNIFPVFLPRFQLDYSFITIQTAFFFFLESLSLDFCLCAYICLSLWNKYSRHDESPQLPKIFVA